MDVRTQLTRWSPLYVSAYSMSRAVEDRPKIGRDLLVGEGCRLEQG